MISKIKITKVVFTSFAIAKNSILIKNNQIINFNFLHFITLLKIKSIIYNFISNNIFIYIINNIKLNTINRNTIILNKVLLNNTIITINFINTLYILKLLIDLLLINILIEQQTNINFYNNKYCIIISNNN